MMKNKNLNAFSIEYEGKCEEIFITFLKDIVYRNSILRKCKKHSKLISGSIRNNNIDGEHKDCCEKYIIIDKDNLEDKKIDDCLVRCRQWQIDFVITDPCFELILLCFFQDINSNKTKKWIDEEFYKIFKNNGKHFDKDKKVENTKWIIEFIKKKIKQDEKLVHQWESRLNILKNKEISNFIDIVELLKKKKNTNNK